MMLPQTSFSPASAGKNTYPSSRKHRVSVSEPKPSPVGRGCRVAAGEVTPPASAGIKAIKKSAQRALPSAPRRGARVHPGVSVA